MAAALAGNFSFESTGSYKSPPASRISSATTTWTNITLRGQRRVQGDYPRIEPHALDAEDAPISPVTAPRIPNHQHAPTPAQAPVRATPRRLRRGRPETLWHNEQVLKPIHPLHADRDVIGNGTHPPSIISSGRLSVWLMLLKRDCPLMPNKETPQRCSGKQKTITMQMSE